MFTPEITISFDFLSEQSAHVIQTYFKNMGIPYKFINNDNAFTLLPKAVLDDEDKKQFLLTLKFIIEEYKDNKPVLEGYNE